MTVSVKGLTALTTSGDQTGILILQLMSLMRGRCGEPGNESESHDNIFFIKICKVSFILDLLFLRGFILQYVPSGVSEHERRKEK